MTASPDRISAAESVPFSAEFLAAVADIYDWVDQQVAAAAPVCEISGRCCRFRDYGHRLYLTRVEADRLFTTPLPADAAAKTAPDQVREQCPYQVAGRCTARDERPLSCRIFFCDPQYAGRGEEITEEALARLKRVHKQFDVPWEYAELSYFFERRQDRL